MEKQVLLHVKERGEEQPRSITLVMFLYCLSTLREKGLVEFKTNCDEVIRAGLTIKGAAYIERNPKLTNPVDWKGIITLGLMMAAITVALFVICNRLC